MDYTYPNKYKYCYFPNKGASITTQANFMTIAKEFFEALQSISKTEPLIAVFLDKYLHYRDGFTFETILKAYATYFSELSRSDKEKLSNIFWEQIKFFGTPIIENDLQDNSNCHVYFLFPKNKLENNNDLYLQGAVHGYGGINERNKLDELTNTGIMYRINSIPTDAILNYQYQQNGAATLDDDNSCHRNMYHHRYSGGVILKVTPDRKQSQLGKPLGKEEEEKYWERMVSSQSTNSNKHFKYHITFYSDSNNKLHTCDTPLPQKVDIYNPVPPNLHEIPGEDFSGSPYANFMRAVHIFKPSSDQIKIKNVIIFNDGRPYILAGMMDQAEKMVNAGKLPADTALVFIDALPALAKSMSDVEKDKIFIMGGMGVRFIDFDKGIVNYITFLKSLFPQLEKDINIPNDPKYRVMVGSSLSGTATIYIALKEPEICNHFIAQSPSPSNDEILLDVKANPETSIQLSCGLFEQPRYNDAETDCFNYANKLEKRFSLPFHPGIYGHNHAACIEDLERSLPVALKSSHALDAEELKKSAKSPSVVPESFFSPNQVPSTQSTKSSPQQSEESLVLRKKGG